MLNPNLSPSLPLQGPVVEPPTQPSCPIIGQVFTPCGSACPPTCENLNPICTKQCVPGCQCPAGTVLKGNRCVKPKFCTLCYLSNTRTHTKPFTLKVSYLSPSLSQVCPFVLHTSTAHWSVKFSTRVALPALPPVKCPTQSAPSSVPQAVSAPVVLYWMTIAASLSSHVRIVARIMAEFFY